MSRPQSQSRPFTLKFLIVLGLAVLLNATTPVSQAALVTHTITGTVTFVNAELMPQFQVGQAVIYYITFDDATPDVDASAEIGGYFEALKSVSGTIGSYAFSAPNANAHITILNNHPTGFDEVTLNPYTPTGAAVNGRLPFLVNHGAMADVTQTDFQTTLLAELPPEDLSKFTNRGGDMSFKLPGFSDARVAWSFTTWQVAVPTTTSATYDAGTGVLTVTGAVLPALSGASNDIDVSKLTLTGEGGSTYTLTTASVEVSSDTSFSVTLNATDKAAVNPILNKNGASSTSATTYNLAAAEDWAAGAAAAVVVADLTDNGVTVSNVATPTITSATYDAGTGVLAVTGTGLLKLSGANNDIDVSKLTLSGDSTTYTVTSSSDEIGSGTSFAVTLNATDQTALITRLNKNGTSSISGTNYNLAAAEDWAAGADGAVVVADLTGNGITVSNAAVPPAAPSTPDLAAASDTGSSSTDNVTGNTTPTFTGTAEANSTVQLYRAGSTPIGTSVADGSGNWSITASTIPDGTHSITATATSTGGTGPASSALSITVDTASPSVTINQSGGQADPTGAAPINFTVVFSEAVTGFATGDVSLSGTAGATTGTVTGSDTTFTVAVSGMTGAGTVSVSIAPGVATDTAGTANAAATSTDNTVTYAVPPSVSMSFTPNSIGVGLISTLKVTIDNTANVVGASSLAFTNNLPAGLIIANPAGISATGPGGLTGTPGTGLFAYTGGQVAANSILVVSVNVVGSTPGVYTSTTGNLTSNLGNSGTASATLKVNVPPTLTMAFSPTSIALGGVSTLTFTINNGTSTADATALNLTANLPIGMTIAATPNATTGCTGGTLTAVAGATQFQYTGGTVLTLSTCTVSVDVMSKLSGASATATGSLTSNLGVSTGASANLAVVAGEVVPTLTEWGIIGLTLILALAAVFRVRRLTGQTA